MTEKKMFDRGKVDVNILNWGPCVIKLKMVDELKKYFIK